MSFIEELTGFADVFFNGRPARSTAKSKVTVEEIVRRGVCHVRLNGKVYRIEASEVRPADSNTECRICRGQGCIQETGRTCPECKGSGKATKEDIV